MMQFIKIRKINDRPYDIGKVQYKEKFLYEIDSIDYNINNRNILKVDLRNN